MTTGFQSATPEGAHHTQTDVWITPKWIIDIIGISDLDPCGFVPDGKPIVATARNYFTEEQDGLVQPWFGSVYCNPPYSDLKTWVQKCADYHAETGNDVIVLCFARTDTQAFQRHAKRATGINFINKRIKFITSDGEVKGNGNAPSCLIAYGESALNRIYAVDGIVTRIIN